LWVKQKTAELYLCTERITGTRFCDGISFYRGVRIKACGTGIGDKLWDFQPANAMNL
jgi:hypothetical protein